MADVRIRIINRSKNALPAYATGGAAGLDIRADLTEALTLQPLERRLVPTGLFMELPEGFEAQIRPRSGLAAQQGITCLNSPGTIDSDYRGEIRVLLINLSGEAQVVGAGERIAQMVIQKVEKAMFEQVEVLEVSQRSDGGFGSTGKK